MAELSQRERELLGITTPTPDTAQQLSPREQELLGEPVSTPAPVETAASTDGGDDLAEQAKLGLKESVLPFAVGKEEERQAEPRTTSGKVVRGLANIAADIATGVAGARLGAAAGAAVGGVPGALVGGAVTGGLALYKALGYEKIRSDAEDRPMSPKNIAVNLAAEGLPMLRHSKAMTNAALSVGQAAATFEQARQYGASGEMAALLATVSGGLGAATRVKITPEEQRVLGSAAMLADPDMTRKGIEGLKDVASTADGSLKLTERTYKHLEEFRDSEDALRKATLADVKGEGFDRWRSRVDHDVIDGVLKLPEAQKLVRDMKTEGTEWHGFMIRLQKAGVTEIPDDFAAYLVAKDNRDGLVKMVTGRAGRRAGNSAEEILKREATTTNDAYNMYRVKRVMRDLLSQSDMEGKKDPLRNPLMKNLLSDYHAARAMDFVLGTDFRSKIDHLATSELSHKAVVQGYDKKIGQLEKEAFKLKVPLQDIGRVLEMPGTERRTYLQKRFGERSPDVVNHLIRWRRLFDDVRRFGVDNKIEVPYRQHYVTSVRQDLSTLVGNMHNAWDGLNQQLTKAGVAPTTSISDAFDALEDSTARSTLKQLVDAASLTANRNIATLGELKSAVKSLSDPDSIKRQVGFEASAAFAREGNLPELIRERNVGAVMRSYARNMSRAVHLDQPIKDLNEMQTILRTAGFRGSSEWLDHYLRSQSGDPGAVTSWMLREQAKARIALQAATAAAKEDGGWYRVAGPKAKQLAMDVGGLLTTQIYPNFLGGRVGPVFRNLLQLPLMSGPEIGGLAGQNVVRKAVVRSAVDRAKGVNLEKSVLDYIQAAKTHPEVSHLWKNVMFAPGTTSPFDEGLYLNAAMRGLEAGGVVDKSRRFLEASGRAALYLYGKADAVNRYMSIKAAETLTQDLMDGKSYARRWILKTDPAFRSDLLRLTHVAARTLDPHQLTQLQKTLEYTVAGYLISKTQFHYTKASSFRLGRELGPLFSVFTKFPVMVGSDVAEGFRQGRGISNLAAKYVAPLVALAAVHHTLAGDDSPRAQALMLKDAWRLSPLSAPFEVKPPPVISTAKDITQGLLGAFTGDLDKIKTAGSSAWSTYAPFQWVPKASNELETFITGRKP